MKTIKFKAKSTLNGNWIFGHYIYFEDKIFQHQIFNSDRFEPVDPATVCQFIKMHNGEELYEGDILSEPVEVDSKMVDSQEPIFYSEKEAAYCVDMSFSNNRSMYHLLNEYDLSSLKIAGNIHDKNHAPQVEK